MVERIYSRLKTQNKAMYFIVVLVLSYVMIRHFIHHDALSANVQTILINRVLAFFSMIFIGMSLFKRGRTRRAFLSRQLALLGFAFAISHIIMTLLFFSEQHFPIFFDHQELNLKGELILSTGVLSIAVFCLPFIASFKVLGSRFYRERTNEFFMLSYISYVFSILHVCIIGMETWFTWESWPMLLPPISLIAFVISTGLVLNKLFRIFNYPYRKSRI